MIFSPVSKFGDQSLKLELFLLRGTSILATKKIKTKFKTKLFIGNRHFMQLFSADATIFSKKICPQKVENYPKKLLIKFFTNSSAKTAGTEKFMFQIVADGPAK